MHGITTSYLSTSYNSELNAVLATWHGYADATEAKAGFQNIYELLRYHGAEYVLADLRDHDGGFSAITDWLQEEYMPGMIASGYKACANVLPEEFLAYVSLNDFQDKQAGVVPLRVFASVEEANEWIASLQVEKISRISFKAVA